MKSYPSIPASTGTKFREIPNCHVFDKLDGSSMRSEWSKKRGWYKHGQRKGLIDGSNPHLSQVPKLFEDTLAEPLGRLAADNRWKHLVVFYEFWGEKSVAGLHSEGDPKFLTIFDAAVDKRGLLPPRDFRKFFEEQVPTARFLGRFNWTRGFVEQVRLGEIDGITFEGVVGKAGNSPHKLVRTKAKTQVWIDTVRKIHGDKAEAIINS